MESMDFMEGALKDDSDKITDDEDDEGNVVGDDDDNDNAVDGSVDESLRWSFYECVVNGSVDGVERFLAKDPSLANEAFRLSAIYDPLQQDYHCHCWMFFELGFQVDVNVGFYPGSLSWNERAYPPPPD